MPQQAKHPGGCCKGCRGDAHKVSARRESQHVFLSPSPTFWRLARRAVQYCIETHTHTIGFAFLGAFLFFVCFSQGFSRFSKVFFFFFCFFSLSLYIYVYHTFIIVVIMNTIIVVTVIVMLFIWLLLLLLLLVIHVYMCVCMHASM